MGRGNRSEKQQAQALTVYPVSEDTPQAPRLTPQEHIFCAEFAANGGNGAAAVRKAWPDKERPDDLAYRLLMRHEVLRAVELLRCDVASELRLLAPRAVQRMGELMECTSHPKVAFMATADVLNRTGHREPERRETVITIRFEGGGIPIPSGEPGWSGEVIDVTPTHQALPQQGGHLPDVVD